MKRTFIKERDRVETVLQHKGAKKRKGSSGHQCWVLNGYAIPVPHSSGGKEIPLMAARRIAKGFVKATGLTLTDYENLLEAA